MDVTSDELERLARKYMGELGSQIDIESSPSKKTFSREYTEFKKQYLAKNLTFYEKMCTTAEKIFHIKPSPKKQEELQKSIDICHLEITPSGAISFAYLVAVILAVGGSLLGFMITQSMFFVMVSFILAIIIVTPVSSLPIFIANSWRMKASNQMVLSIFYVVTYMRHTSNLELAIEFAAKHLAPPLSLDLKKVLWNVETSKYSSVREALDVYLGTWKEWNREYIESFHLIESSLYEGEESRRLELLDKALDVMLEETYEKMLHYAQNLSSPMTMLNMLGIIMPILGLVILPLVVSFLAGEDTSPKFLAAVIAFMYNIAIPIGVFYFGKVILSSRPTGYGGTDVSEENHELKKYRNIIIRIGSSEIKISPLMVSILVGVIFMMIGFSPIIMHSLGLNDFGFGGISETSQCGKTYCFLEYKEVSGKLEGPYGLGSGLISLFVVAGLGLSLGLYFRGRSSNVIKVRDSAKKLEEEFASALFQLGGRLGDGIPAEMAFGKVADETEGTISGNFFKIVDSNIKRVGMSVKEAIFNDKNGALVSYPSKVISSSMEVFIEGVRKGPKIAAQALLNIARYIKEIHKVDERLKDLLADIISSMKSNINFLAPVIAGIVVGISSMISNILGSLSTQMQGAVTEGGNLAGAGGISNLFGSGVPTFYFQVIVGIYIVQIIYILTILANGIENGEDKLSERFMLGNNLIKGTFLYCFVTFFIMLAFSAIVSQVLTKSIA